jgi:hypothetical protein
MRAKKGRFLKRRLPDAFDHDNYTFELKFEGSGAGARGALQEFAEHSARRNLD